MKIDKVYGDLKPSINIEHDSTTIDATKWPNMSISELYDELLTMQERFNVLLSMQQYPVASQLASGINNLRELIFLREEQQEDKLQDDILQ